MYQIASVLDLGCGDVEIIRDLDIANYHGVDISDVVITRNKTVRSDWSFERNSIGDMKFLGNADMVLCLDVLIHQPSRAGYELVIKNALDHSGKIALFSGYTKPSKGWNVFFYEPLDQTIRRISPSSQIVHVASYRDTDLFAVSNIQ